MLYPDRCFACGQIITFEFNKIEWCEGAEDMMDAPEAAIHRGGPAIHRGGPVASMDIDNPTYVDES